MKRFAKVMAACLLAAVVVLPTVFAQGEPLAGTDTSAGEAVFNSNCLACHQMSGQGIPGAFPPLAGHLPEVLAVEGGRAFAINVVLYGLMGQINIGGMPYNSVMTPWGPMLNDQQIADVLNYAAKAWGNDAALPEGFLSITADEVAAQRATTLDSAAVYAKRQALGLE